MLLEIAEVLFSVSTIAIFYYFERSIVALQAKIDTLETKQKTIKQEQDTIETQQEILKTKQEIFKSKQESLQKLIEKPTLTEKEILLTEKQMLEGDVGYVPNPALTEMTCNFKHRRCKNQPSYTDGTNYYCWTHSIMIQLDKYK